MIMCSCWPAFFLSSSHCNMEAESSKMGSARIFHKKPKVERMNVENSKQAEAQSRKPLRKGNTGRLAGLISLPLDLLFEVSNFLV